MASLRGLLLCLFAVLLVHSSARAQARGSELSGTWSGEIAITTPDGKVQHDTAVLVLKQKGSVLTGTIGRTAEQQSPITQARVEAGQLRFHIEAGGGMDFALLPSAGELRGTAVGTGVKAAVTLRPSTRLMTQDELAAEIAEADRRVFEAFGKCDVSGFAAALADDLEFFHDRTGKTDHAQNVAMLRKRCAEGTMVRRELVPDSVVVNAAPGYGAIHTGVHRFYSRQSDGSERLEATARFTHVWSNQSGTWKLTRVISYDHR